AVARAIDGDDLDGGVVDDDELAGQLGGGDGRYRQVESVIEVVVLAGGEAGFDGVQIGFRLLRRGDGGRRGVEHDVGLQPGLRDAAGRVDGPDAYRLLAFPGAQSDLHASRRRERAVEVEGGGRGRVGRFREIELGRVAAGVDRQERRSRVG